MASVSRRRLLGGMALLLTAGTSGSLWAACQPQVVERPVEVTRVVEKPVEKVVTQVVEKEKVVVATPAPGAMRDLKGKIWIMDRGSTPLRGQPPTARQQALAAALAQYKIFHPEVEVELTDVPPTAPDTWLHPMYAAHQAPDILHADAEPLSASVGSVQAGAELEVMNFFEFADEPNPYSGGRPWKQDWPSELLRYSRGNSEADKFWVHIHNQQLIRCVYANLDICKQFGFDGDLGKLSYTEAFDLFKRIEADGEFAAWEGYAGSVLVAEQFSIVLGQKLWEEGGGHPDNPGEHLFPQSETMANKCQGLWVMSRPEIKESYLQLKRFVDTFKGGVPGYYAAAESGYIHAGKGQGWLNGKTAFWFASTVEFNQIKEAEAAKTLQVQEFKLVSAPYLAKEDLFDKSLEIYNGGHFHAWQGGFNQFLATNGKYRRNGPSDQLDLIIRDMLQFFTSIHGGRVVIANGDVPENPEVMELMDPRLKQAFEVRHPSIRNRGNRYFGLLPPPGANSVRGWEQGFMLGELSYEEFAQRVDNDGMRESVQWYSDNGSKRGWPKLDASCSKFGATWVQ